MIEPPLDLDGVQAFVRIAELGSFTRAADALQTTQSATGPKPKRLEERLGFRLLERTPRYVELSAQEPSSSNTPASCCRCTTARSRRRAARASA